LKFVLKGKGPAVKRLFKGVCLKALFILRQQGKVNVQCGLDSIVFATKRKMQTRLVCCLPGARGLLGIAEEVCFVAKITLEDYVCVRFALEPFTFILNQWKGSLSLFSPQNGPKG